MPQLTIGLGTSQKKDSAAVIVHWFNLASVGIALRNAGMSPYATIDSAYVKVDVATTSQYDYDVQASFGDSEGTSSLSGLYLDVGGLNSGGSTTNYKSAISTKSAASLMYSGTENAGDFKNDRDWLRVQTYRVGITKHTWNVRASIIVNFTNYQVPYKFLNYDGSLLQSGTVDYGTAPSYTGATPTKPSDVQYHYTFATWTPSVGAITSDTTYTAQYSSTTRQYNITGIVGGVGGGTITGYDAIPYNYGTQLTLVASSLDDRIEFVQWSDGEPSPSRTITVVGHMTYTAIFAFKKFDVTFKDDNGTVLKTESVEYGSTATPPDDPEKADTAQWNYTFDGWYDGNGNKWTSSVTITSAITFTARYSSEVQKYTVRWYNHDGTLLETDENVPYGTKPTYNGETPTQEGNAEHSYQFAGWNYDTENGITPALGTTYIDITAQFREIDNTYTVKWVNDGVVIEEDEAVPYGAQPDYNGATPTKESDAQYDYDFIGWSVEVKDPVTDGTDYPDDTELPTVAGDIIYTAVYSATTRIYPITVIVYDKNGIYVTHTYAFEYGKELSINALATDVVGYKFVQWSDGNTDDFRTIQVTGEATYQAEYERLPIPFRVNTEQVTGVYIVPDTNTIVYVISGTVPTVTPTTDTVDGLHFEVSNSVPDNSYPLEKLYINRTRIW